MGKQHLPPWVLKLIYLGTVTTVVTFVSFGARSKLKIWSYFSQTTARSSSASTSGTLANPQENQKPEDSTSMSLVSENTNRLEGTAQNEGGRQTLTEAESYREYEIRKREALIRELDSRIRLSTSRTALIESDWHYLRESGLSEESICVDPTFRPFPIEESIRNVHWSQIWVLQNEINEYLTNPREPTEEEKQKQKNEILLQRISRRHGRIREINFLITKSNAITANREAEWESILNATARRARGLRRQIIMDQPAFKQLEKDKVQVLASEQASRTTYQTKVWVLRERNEKDKKKIIN